MMATTGRVKVKVDVTRARSHRRFAGDERGRGLAMKSEPVEVADRKMHAPGTMIGKALEPLGKGVGEILVLFSLQ